MNLRRAFIPAVLVGVLGVLGVVAVHSNIKYNVIKNSQASVGCHPEKGRGNLALRIVDTSLKGWGSWIRNDELCRRGYTRDPAKRLN